MTLRPLARPAAALLVVLLSACGGGEADVGALEQGDVTPEEASAAVDPVGADQLRDLLPASLGAMERTNAEGATQGAMGFSVTEAEAAYEGGGAEVEVKIVDLGGMPSLDLMGLSWLTTDVDRETSTGYERTVTHGGHRGYRTYDSETRDGEFSLLVADRFLVTVEGDDVDDQQLEDALRAIDLVALADLRDAGRGDA